MLLQDVCARIYSRVADWKAVPSAVATYRKATLVYALFFLLKVAVQAPLYLAGMVDALGVAKLALGLPAFALVTWFIFLMHRRVVAHMATRPAND